MLPSVSTGMNAVGSRARRRQARVLNWDQNRALILRYYETENKPLRKVCEIMREHHSFDAT
jgi:hypothetical protein